MSLFCPDCEADPSLGQPSYARWVGPDGDAYCSMHFIRRFGHNERLIRIAGYEPPPVMKRPIPTPADLTKTGRAQRSRDRGKRDVKHAV